MGIYSSYIFPRLCDFILNRAHVADQRRELLQHVEGRVLEIGFGTGLNLPWYPKQLQQLSVIEPNAGMHRHAQERIRNAGIMIDAHRITATALPFAECTFDTVVSTFTLCSIKEVNVALSEVYRVLKPSGRFLFLEHGLSSEPQIKNWQRRLNWLQKSFGDGCHLDRNIKELVAAQAFTSIDMQTQYLEKRPELLAIFIEG